MTTPKRKITLTSLKAENSRLKKALDKALKEKKQAEMALTKAKETTVIPKTVLELKDANSFTECLPRDVWDYLDGSIGHAMVKGEKHRFLLQKPKDKRPFILIYDEKDKMVHDIYKA